MTDASNSEPSLDAIIAGDGAAIATSALLLGLFLSTQLSPIIAAAGPPFFVFGFTLVGWPAAIFARVRGHHGVVRAGAWGAGLAVPFAFVTLLGASYAEAVRSLGLGACAGVVAWLVVKAQGLVVAAMPRRYRNAGRYWVAGLLGAGVIAALVVMLRPPSQEAVGFVASVEIPLATPADRADLLAILNRRASADGLRVSDQTEASIEMYKRAPRQGGAFVESVLDRTIDISVWRGRDLEILMEDGGHKGRPWMTFSRGKDTDLATRTRVQLISDVKARWPQARDVPVTPSGGLPFARDLDWTGTAYVVKPDRRNAYGMASP